MEEKYSSEMFVSYYKIIRLHNLQDRKVNNHRREPMKTYNFK
jgi:hypothetical protein